MSLGKCYGNNLQAAKLAAIEQSKLNPKLYYVITNAFGLFIHSQKRLNIFDPSSTIGGFYIKNGKVKPYTKAQIINDQIHTPTMY